MPLKRQALKLYRMIAVFDLRPHGSDALAVGGVGMRDHSTMFLIN